MKLQVSFYPNPDVTEINVNKSLLKFAFDDSLIGKTTKNKKSDPVLGKRLKRIKGILNVGIAEDKDRRYIIRLTKGKLFNWEVIHPKAIKIIKEIIVPNEEIELLP